MEHGKALPDTVPVGFTRYNRKGYEVFDTTYSCSNYSGASITSHYQFDSLLTKRMDISGGHPFGQLNRFAFTYDAFGKLMEIEASFLPEMSGLGPSIVRSQLKYDALNRLTEKKSTPGRWTPPSRETYEYDARGNRIKTNYYDAEGEMVETSILTEYDRHNNPVKFFRLRQEEKQLLTYHVYNTSGQLMETEKTPDFTDKQRWKLENDSTVTVKYHYDDRGLLVKEDIYSEGQFLRQMLYRYIR